jgi:hypothetical protein
MLSAATLEGGIDETFLASRIGSYTNLGVLHLDGHFDAEEARRNVETQKQAGRMGRARAGACAYQTQGPGTPNRGG